MADLIALPVAQLLLDCLCVALADEHAEGDAPQFCCLRAGDNVAHDAGTELDLCCAGLAYVRIAGIFPTGATGAPFPSPETDTALTGCGPLAWGVSLQAGIMRCSPQGDERFPPTCDEWNEAARISAVDMKALRMAICCFLDSPTLDPGDVAIGTIVPNGPAGGCMEVSVGISVMRIANECNDC
jgi:hypothetical protein